MTVASQIQPAAMAILGVGSVDRVSLT
jgi:hypothetical protein